MPIPVDLPLSLEGTVSLWNSADEAINFWHMIGDAGQVLQLLLLIVLVVAGMRIVYSFIQKFIRRDAEE